MIRLTLVLILLTVPVLGQDGIIGDTVMTGTAEGAWNSPNGDASMLSTATHYYTASAGDWVDSMWIWTWQSAGGTIDLRIYDMTSGDTVAIAVAETISPGTDHQLYGVDVNYELTAGNVYAIATGDETGSVGWAYDASTGATSTSNTGLAATWVRVQDENTRFVMYATVENTPAGGAGQIITIEDN